MKQFPLSKKVLSCRSLVRSGKMLLFTGMLTMMCAYGFAQQRAPHRDRLDPVNDKIEYQGYTIRLIPAADGTIGYDIFKNQHLLVHQFRNPVMTRLIYKKEDAYKIAQWMIAQYAKTNHFPPSVPPGVVKELHLSSIN